MTITNADAARITDYVAAALGWIDYQTTKNLEPIQHEGRWYLSVSDGEFWYLVRLDEADAWQNEYKPADGEHAYTEFCQSVDCVDPRTVADIFADLDEMSRCGGIGGDATYSVAEWLRRLDVAECERIGDVIKAPGISAYRPEDGGEWYGELEDANECAPRYRCVSDRYDQSPVDTYTYVDFQVMCAHCFGEEANLTQDGYVWRDETGAVVLEPVDE